VVSPEREHEQSADSPALHLRDFLPPHAAEVAGWVSDAHELFWLAPSTDPPLTAAKVVAWTADRGRAFVLFCGDGARPIGYAELNPMQRRADHLWIGHVIIAPAWRGRGLGAEFMRLLLDHAFGALHAGLVSLIVFPNNRQAIQCYLNAGFNFRDEQFHPFGRPAKNYRMLHLVSVPPVRPPAQVRRDAAQLSPTPEKRRDSRSG
jgi:RimJ/RimL family protein N-acetyltransferase